MTDRIKNIINKEIELATGNADATTFEGYDFINDLCDDFMTKWVEQYMTNYARIAIDNYINTEEEDKEQDTADTMENLFAMDGISWGEF